MNSVTTHVANLETRVEEPKGKVMGDIGVALRSVSGTVYLDMPYDVARELYVYLGSQMDQRVRAKDPARQPY